MTEKLIAKVKSTFKEIAKNTNVVNNKDDYLGVSLLVDKEGNITTNAAAAVVISIYNFLNSTGSEFLNGTRLRNEEDLERFIGDTSGIPDVDSFISELNASNMYLKSNTIVATDLGSSVMSTLGLRAKPGALTETEEAKLKSTLGVVAISVGKSLNIFDTSTYNDVYQQSKNTNEDAVGKVKGFSANSHVNKDRTAIRTLTRVENKKSKTPLKTIITVQASSSLKLGDETNLTKLRKYVTNYVESNIKGKTNVATAPGKTATAKVSGITLTAKGVEGKPQNVEVVYTATEEGKVTIKNIVLVSGTNRTIISGKGKVKKVENVDPALDVFGTVEDIDMDSMPDTEGDWDLSSYDGVMEDAGDINWGTTPDSVYDNVVMDNGTITHTAELYSVTYNTKTSAGVSLTHIRDIAETLKSVLEVEPTYSSTISHTPVSNKHELRRAEFSTPNAKVVETLDKLGEMPFKLSSVGDWIHKQVKEKGLPQTIVTLVKAYGYIDETSEGFINSSFSEKQSIIGKNSAIRESVESMVHLVENMSTSEERNNIFYNWFAAKNERKHIEVRDDGVKGSADPQADKLGARWLVAPLRSDSEYNSLGTELITELEEMVSENGKLDSNLNKSSFRDKYFDALELMYGVVQGFDDFTKVVKTKNKIPAVDKNSTAEDVVRAFKELRELASQLDANGTSKLETAIEQFLEGIDNTSEELATKGHFGHAIMSAKTLLDINTAVKDGSKTFTHEQLVEWDGKTNGVAFKFMQKPLGHNFMQHLYAMGVVPESDKHHNTQTRGVEGDRNPGGVRELDPYQFLGSTLAENLVAIRSNVVDLIKSKIARAEKNKFVQEDLRDSGKAYNEEIITNSEKKIKHFNKAQRGVETLENNNLFIDISNRLSSVLRNIAKKPTMIFGYGAGLYKIGEAVVDEQFNALMEDIIKKGDVSMIVRIVKDTENFDITEKQAEELIQLLRTRDMRTVSLQLGEGDNATTLYFKDVADTIREGMNVTYGTAVKAALNQHFGDYIELNNIESSTMGAAFDLLDVLYQVKVNTAIKHKFMKDGITTDISKEEKTDIIKSLMQLVPAIDTPDSVNDYDNLKLIDGSFGREITDGSKNNIVNLHELSGTHKNSSVSVFAPLFKLDGPNAKTPVMGTHVQDASTLASTWLEAVESNNPFTMMHDAMIKLAGGNLSKLYNKNFYENNRYYSQAESLKNYLQRFERRYANELESALRDFDKLGSIEVGAKAPDFTVSAPFALVNDTVLSSNTGMRNNDEDVEDVYGESGSDELDFFDSGAATEPVETHDDTDSTQPTRKKKLNRLTTAVINKDGTVANTAKMLYNFSNIPVRGPKEYSTRAANSYAPSEVSSLADQIDLQRQYADVMADKREDLYRNDLKIMQMGGIAGSAYHTKDTVLTTEKDVTSTYNNLLNSDDENVKALLAIAKEHKGWKTCG
jgi:hypothetical protein